MFTLLTLTSQVLANLHKITDEASWRNFLKELVLLVRTRAAETKTPLDDVLMKGIDLMLKNDGLFGYAYWLIYEQCQTSEILFESVYGDTVVGLVEDAVADNPEAIDPVVIIAIVNQIVSLINTIKTIRNR